MITVYDDAPDGNKEMAEPRGEAIDSDYIYEPSEKSRALPKT